MPKNAQNAFKLPFFTHFSVKIRSNWVHFTNLLGNTYLITSFSLSNRLTTIKVKNLSKNWPVWWLQKCTLTVLFQKFRQINICTYLVLYYSANHFHEIQFFHMLCHHINFFRQIILEKSSLVKMLISRNIYEYGNCDYV